jgi:transcriptional antiterminator RfaH
MILVGPEIKNNNKFPWSVLYVAPNHEKRVSEHLTVRSFEHYLPLYKEQSRWTDRTVQLMRPLFPRYVFVRFAPQEQHILKALPSVLYLLGDGKQEIVSAAEINRIRDGLEKGCVLRPHPEVAIGTHVRVRQGIFEGAVGIVTKFSKQCKVVLKLEATQQRFSVEVDSKDLEVPQMMV